MNIFQSLYSKWNRSREFPGITHIFLGNSRSREWKISGKWPTLNFDNFSKKSSSSSYCPSKIEFFSPDIYWPHFWATLRSFHWRSERRSNKKIIMDQKLAILLVICLFHLSNAQTEDTTTNREPTCQSNKLQGILKDSMKEVLREFGFDDASQNETNPIDAAQVQDCPSDWIRIQDSCFWVSPPSVKLNAENSTSYCKTMVENSRLFEPRSQLQNSLVRELVTALDGSHRNENIWIGFNDHQHDGRFFYDSTDEPIIFTNWTPGQPDGGSSQNCVIYDSREELKSKWHDASCSHNFRFICEKPL